MLWCPHEMLQNHPIGIEGVTVQNNSSQNHGALLRVAASSNHSVNRTPGKLRLSEVPEHGHLTSLVPTENVGPLASSSRTSCWRKSCARSEEHTSELQSRQYL